MTERLLARRRGKLRGNALRAARQLRQAAKRAKALPSAAVAEIGEIVPCNSCADLVVSHENSVLRGVATEDYQQALFDKCPGKRHWRTAEEALLFENKDGRNESDKLPPDKVAKRLRKDPPDRAAKPRVHREKLPPDKADRNRSAELSVRPALSKCRRIHIVRNDNPPARKDPPERPPFAKFLHSLTAGCNMLMFHILHCVLMQNITGPAGHAVCYGKHAPTKAHMGVHIGIRILSFINFVWLPREPD